MREYLLILLTIAFTMLLVGPFLTKAMGNIAFIQLQQLEYRP